MLPCADIRTGIHIKLEVWFVIRPWFIQSSVAVAEEISNLDKSYLLMERQHQHF
jgi:hypothetical protein